VEFVSSTVAQSILFHGHYARFLSVRIGATLFIIGQVFSFSPLL
jgi:hypothetical protein